MTIRAIIFDYGQVLNAPADERWMTQHRTRLAERLGIATDDLWPYLFEGEAAQKWMTGRLSWDEFWVEVLRPAGITEPAEIAVFAHEVFKGGEQINPEMTSLLAELKGRYKLAIVSNASWTEAELIEMLVEDHGLPADTFDVVVTSTSAGVVKPHPAIFRLALERLGVRPAEAIFTDDLANFTKGAAKLGIHTHTFTTPAALRNYFVKKGVLPDVKREA
jgi:epoxide hydrolase-like predicted phosphatase